MRNKSRFDRAQEYEREYAKRRREDKRWKHPDQMEEYLLVSEEEVEQARSRLSYAENEIPPNLKHDYPDRRDRAIRSANRDIDELYSRSYFIKVVAPLLKEMGAKWRQIDYCFQILLTDGAILAVWARTGAIAWQGKGSDRLASLPDQYHGGVESRLKAWKRMREKVSR